MLRNQVYPIFQEKFSKKLDKILDDGLNPLSSPSEKRVNNDKPEMLFTFTKESAPCAKTKHLSLKLPTLNDKLLITKTHPKFEKQVNEYLFNVNKTLSAVDGSSLALETHLKTYNSGVLLSSNPYFPEILQFILPTSNLLGSLFRFRSHKTPYGGLFYKSQIEYDNAHFGFYKENKTKNIHKFIDPDSKASIGTINQKKATYLFSRFSDDAGVQTLESEKGSNADFVFKRNGKTVYLDVKLVRLPTHIAQNDENIELRGHINGDICLSSQKISSLVVDSLNNFIKNPNPKILLNIDAYPPQPLLQKLEAYQFQLNNEVLPYFKKNFPHVNSSLKFYFCFTGSIPQDSNLEFSEVLKFNLSVLKEFPEINDSVIEEISNQAGKGNL